MIRSPLRSLATLVFAVAVSTCSDGPNGAPTPAKSTGPARVALAATFSKAAAAVYSQRNEFAGASFDHVRIILRRPAPDSIAKDTTVAFTPTSPDITLDFTIDGASPGDVFSVELQFLNGSAMVYRGTGSAQAYAPDGTPPTQQPIVVVYVGPGSNAVRITVAPKTIPLVFPATATFTITAVDANNVAVANIPVSWTTSDPTVATISSSGLLSTTGKRGTVTVTATTVTGLTDNGSATVSLPASAIVLVSGGAQTGKAGTTLPQPAVVRVTASDGVGVGGASVNFSPPAGGKVGSSSVTTDSSGLASTSLTLGSAVGAQGFAATTGGLSVGIPETASAADAGSVIAVSGSGQIDTVKHVLKNPFVAKVTDQFGNPVAGATVVWSRTTGSGTLSAASTTSGSDGTTSVTYTLGITAGTETVTAAVSGVATLATFTAQAVTGIASAVVIVSGNGQSGRAGSPLAAPFIVRVTDDAGNPVIGAPVTWTATNGTVAASTISDGTGLSSNAMTLGNTVGPASATATVGPPSALKSVIFAATVTGGNPTQLLFVATPPTTAAGSVLTPAVRVNLLDAGGNLSAGTNAVTIAIGANPGDAVLGGTVTRNAVAGVATFNDLTLSAAGNGYTLVATAVGLVTGTSAPFSILPNALSRTWTGNVSNDWFNALNWIGGVPGPTSNVTVPSGTTNAPLLTASASINNLTVAPGASLALGSFTLSATGTVDGGTAPGITGAGSVALIGPGSIRGTISNVSVSGPISLAAATTITGNASVVAGGTLTIAQPLTVTGALTASAFNAALATLTVTGGATVTAGSLTISGISGTFSQTGGTITVTGAATFGGASTVGLITGGILNVGGDFIQTGATSASSFAASGTHRVVLNGSAAQNLNLANSPASHFQDLSLAGTGAVTLITTGGALQLNGQLVSPTGPTTLNASGLTINSAGFDVDGLTINNGLLVSTGGTITRFDNVTFQGYPATATPLTISHPGASAPFTFNNTQFLVTPTTGHYMSVTDSNTGDGQVLTINLVASVPVNGAAATLTAGGAIVNWTGAPGPIAWTNASGGFWSNPFNWNLGRVPGVGDSVIITLPGTYTVTLDNSAYTATYLTLGGASGVQTFSMGPYAMALNNVLTVGTNGLFTIGSGGGIGGPGSVVNKGEIDILNGNLALTTNNQGTIITNGTVQLNGAITTSATSIIRLLPDGVAGGASTTTASGFTNNGLIELTSSALAGDVFSVAGTLTNAAGGTINSLPGVGGGPRSITAFGGLTNQGTINVNQALSINAPGGITNAGQMTLNANLSVILTQGDFTDNAVVTTGAGTTLAVDGGSVANFNVSAAGTLGGLGAISLTNLHGGAISTAFTASQLTLVNSRLGIGTNLSTAVVPLTLFNSTIDGPGVITNSAGVTMPLTNSTISGTSGLVNQGTVIVNATSSIAGPLTMAAGSILRLQPDGTSGVAQLTVASGFTNNGGIELTSLVSNFNSILNVTAGTLTNAAGGTISSLLGTGGVRRLGATVSNAGVINLTQGLNLVVTGNLTNTGTVNVGLGGLSLGSQYGQLTVLGGATLGGTLNVTTFGGFTPASFDTFSVLSYGSVSGNFATYTLPGGLAAWTPTFTSGSTLDLTKN